MDFIYLLADIDNFKHSYTSICIVKLKNEIHIYNSYITNHNLSDNVEKMPIT